jgi:hypothetical protein
MGYLDNSTIIVDAILTRKGRELLARQDGSFKITQFALGDDEIDYTLFNENHPNGSQFSGEAIENMEIIEAFPNENNIMKSKLISLNRYTTQIPILQLGEGDKISLTAGTNKTIEPQTLNFGQGGAVVEASGYTLTIADRRLLSSLRGLGANATIGNVNQFGNTALAESVRGSSFALTSVSSTSLFGNNTSLLTSITIEGIDSGARVTLPLQINKV